MTRRTKPQLTTDLQRRLWPEIDVYGRIERALAAQADRQPAHRRGSAA
jgi:hypothetical protein